MIKSDLFKAMYEYKGIIYSNVKSVFENIYFVLKLDYVKSNLVNYNPIIIRFTCDLSNGLTNKYLNVYDLMAETARALEG